MVPLGWLCLLVIAASTLLFFTAFPVLGNINGVSVEVFKRIFSLDYFTVKSFKKINKSKI